MKDDIMKNRLLAAASLLMFVPAVFAQDAPPLPPAAGQQGPPAMQGRPGRQSKGQEAHDRRSGGGPREMGGGPMGRMLPPGTWWRNSQVVAAVGLSPEQVKKIDETFLQSRMKLIDLHAGLEKSQLELEPLLAGNPVDQGKALAQISKIVDARAELEKTDAKMLLSIRAVLTADQWTKLQAQHGQGPAMGLDGDRRGGRGQRGGPGQGGPGQGGPGGPGGVPQAE
jgi:Spy/CpxP family protein refolding chaperone